MSLEKGVHIPTEIGLHSVISSNITWVTKQHAHSFVFVLYCQNCQLMAICQCFQISVVILGHMKQSCSNKVMSSIWSPDLNQQNEKHVQCILILCKNKWLWVKGHKQLKPPQCLQIMANTPSHLHVLLLLEYCYWETQNCVLLKKLETISKHVFLS